MPVEGFFKTAKNGLIRGPERGIYRKRPGGRLVKAPEFAKKAAYPVTDCDQELFAV